MANSTLIFERRGPWSSLSQESLDAQLMRASEHYSGPLASIEGGEIVVQALLGSSSGWTQETFEYQFQVLESFCAVKL